MKTSLDKLIKNNPSATVLEDNEQLIVSQLWLDDTFECRFAMGTQLKSLENIELPIELIAIYHKDKQELEFIFSVLSKELFLGRETAFFYKGIEIKTKFSAPSKALETLAKSFHRKDTANESRYRGLEIFSDFYKKEDQSEDLKDYFKGKKPYSYYVQCDFKKLNNDFISISKHINVYLTFFDRRSPRIEILNPKPKNETFVLPCHANNGKFPNKISMNSIDPIALDLLQVAHESGNNRLRYLFNYQVLEYFAYYYLDEELKRKLTNILKSPDLLSNPSSYSRTIIEELKDYSNNTSDKQKLTKLLTDYATIEDIESELRCNLKYFSKELEFDGHFKLPSILADEKYLDKLFADSKENKQQKKDREKARYDFIVTVADRVDKIRNVLVHIRESRENKVILPTRENNRKLTPYLFLIRRIAETVAIKYEG